MFKKFITKIYNPLYTNVLTSSSVIMIIFGVNLYFTNIPYLNIIGIIITLVFTLNICILVFRMFNWEFNKEQTELTSEKIFENENSIKKEKSNIPEDINDLINCNFKNSLINQEIIQLLKDIDDNISNGFTFSTISNNKWNNYYKAEIVSNLTSNYELDKEYAERMIKILQKLKESMIDKNKEKDSLRKDTSITAMEKMLNLDGIDDIKLPSIKE